MIAADAVPVTTTAWPQLSDEQFDDLCWAVGEAETVEQVNSIRFPDGVGYFERRALLAWLRFHGRQSDFYADPLLKELRITCWYADHPENDCEVPFAEMDPWWWPGSIEVEPTGPHRAEVHIDSVDGREMASYIIHGLLSGVAVQPTQAVPVGDDLTSAIVENVRVAGLPGGRPPGRPPGTLAALNGMSQRKRMQVAAELVEIGGHTQSGAAAYAGVTRESLNRRLRARRRDRAATGPDPADDTHALRLAPIHRP